MYFTDAGIEELDERRGDEQVTMAWLAERLRDFVDLNPEFETAVDRLAKWLARSDSDDDPDSASVDSASACATDSGPADIHAADFDCERSGATKSGSPRPAIRTGNDAAG